VRPWSGRWYAHSHLRQGHTHRGQVLGAPAQRASAVAADLYHPAGRWTAQWTREVRRPVLAYARPDDPREPDVLHGFGLEAVHSIRHVEILSGVTAAHNLNRDGGADRWNFRFVLGGRAMP
jgi:hypothetical protein